MNAYLRAALASALALAPLAAAEQGAAAADAMKAKSATMATMICRPAAAGEKPTAMMTGQQPLVCKKMAPAMMKDKPGPDLSGKLTPEMVDAAWRAFVNKELNIPMTGGG